MATVAWASQIGGFVPTGDIRNEKGRQLRRPHFLRRAPVPYYAQNNRRWPNVVAFSHSFVRFDTVFRGDAEREAVA
jgi:hypothetical protein